MNYYSFKDDPNTQTDDYLAKAKDRLQQQAQSSQKEEFKPNLV